MMPATPADSLAARYDVGPGVMATVAAHVAPGTEPALLESAIDGTLRQHRASRIADVAERVERLADWDRLVLPDETIASLKNFCDRVRHRTRVLEQWGLGKVMSTSRA